MYGDTDTTIASGTSFDCPYVAACSLVVWSRYPEFNSTAVKSVLITTGMIYEENYDHFKEYVNDEREIFELNLPSFAASFSYSRGECKRKFPRKLKDVNVSEGVYPGAQLYTYVFGCGGCGSSPKLTTDAIEQAQKDGVKVISMSVGTRESAIYGCPWGITVGACTDGGSLLELAQMQRF
ncbi:hypothetical protein POM88_042965 [Heracleum sosnowskyi]|uniref:Peptidase S8/S53 domain-containing protein n=1 Tax=Heracleum sosnowskyi TaxID=360622 RepID=A0AAD8HHM2_9APIA|nr:hypothetical protein POM88_042965 [Heracleum sosnowskyi]